VQREGGIKPWKSKENDTYFAQPKNNEMVGNLMEMKKCDIIMGKHTFWEHKYEVLMYLF
jgi:hypothetical protein